MQSAWVPLTLLALPCIALGILPTYVIPVLDRAVAPIIHESAVAALVPPFFGPGITGEALPPSFLTELHDLGAQIGRDELPGRGLVVLHRGGEQNPVVFAMSTFHTLITFAAVLAVVFAVFRLLARRRALRRGPVWAGGLRRPRPEFTYTELREEHTVEPYSSERRARSRRNLWCGRPVRSDGAAASAGQRDVGS